MGKSCRFDLDPTGELLMVVASGQHRTQVADTNGTEISHATELLTLATSNYGSMLDYYAERDNG
jgi:hypothetical protein